MLFNTFHFLVFFPFVACLHFILPQRVRWIFLLAASYYFYMCWRPHYILLILLSSAVDYWVAIRIGTAASRAHKNWYLFASLLVNFGLLFTFKYYNFFSHTINQVLGLENTYRALPALAVLLPVGISFYTFQEVSYVIDVYRGQQDPQRHFGIFALYVAFFPQLVAGPIERSPRLMPQFSVEHQFSIDRAIEGLRLVLWGMFKKVVIADNLGLYVDAVYNAPREFAGPALVLATVFFAFQIYCDFSGYSDIARGTARILGYNLMVNFDRPYQATSIVEFWQRWHISLSTWFRDYVFLPLGRRRVTVSRWYLNIMIVFTLSGFWHGANWTFVVWGGLHGLYYVLGTATRHARKTLRSAIGIARHRLLNELLQTTMVFLLVCFAWIFFRAGSISDAWYVVRTIPVGWERLLVPEGLHSITNVVHPRPFQVEEVQGHQHVILLFMYMVVLTIVERFARDGDINHVLAARPAWLRWTVYLVLVLAVMNLGVPQVVPFIYFQF